MVEALARLQAAKRRVFVKLSNPRHLGLRMASRLALKDQRRLGSSPFVFFAFFVSLVS